MRILIIEDEENIAEPLKSALEKKGFAVDWESEGRSGQEAALVNEYDCVLLDLNLPGVDGLEISKKLRTTKPTLPILMLTARSQQYDKIRGFESGTDDYLTKPFSFQELLLRINALIRRSTLNQAETMTLGDLEINLTTKSVALAGQPVTLNNKEYGLLEYLLRNLGKAISQEELLEHVWNDEIDTFSQTVKTNIKTLRQKIDPKKKLIKTLRGQGYLIENIKT